ncbi:CLUMA_CG005792, isoform A [Clunio marinus]|uniref:CLUMA_CG005792, isoform A n=1 Tax=Clunio marinus TaxID=568069 RepID=A0A1J1HXE7_9DIPT|nr:CLUMA_CG005792, isoform A [Clunio marinus]
MVIFLEKHYSPHLERKFEVCLLYFFKAINIRFPYTQQAFNLLHEKLSIVQNDHQQDFKAFSMLLFVPSQMTLMES